MLTDVTISAWRTTTQPDAGKCLGWHALQPMSDQFNDLKRRSCWTGSDDAVTSITFLRDESVKRFLHEISIHLSSVLAFGRDKTGSRSHQSTLRLGRPSKKPAGLRLSSDNELVLQRVAGNNALRLLERWLALRSRQ
jgi:hypothetical protein